MSTVSRDAKEILAATPPRRKVARTSRKRLLVDRAARGIVSVAGFIIIAGVLGILAFILIEVWPLFGSAEIRLASRVPLPGAPVTALLSDEHRTHVAVLDGKGMISVLGTTDGRVVSERWIFSDSGQRAGALPVAPEAPPVKGADLSSAAHAPEQEPLVLAGQALPRQSVLTAATSEGEIVLVPVRWEISFREQDRVVTPVLEQTERFALDPERRPIRVFTVQTNEEGALTVAAQLESGELAILHRERSENFMTGEIEESVTREVIPLPSRLTALALDERQRYLYAGTVEGELLRWRLEGGAEKEPQRAPAGSAPITSLGLLLGDESLVVGQEDGSLSVWFNVRQEDGSQRLTRIRDFPPHGGAIRLISSSLRDKSFLAQDESGALGLYYSTSHRTLWKRPSPAQDATALAYTPKGDGAYTTGGGILSSLDVRNPHPEVSIGALFGKIWYEGYDRPEYVWQSSSGTDDFEPKLSLTPLLVGTLKGTLYSLVLALPLGVFGAMYASQFMHPTLKRYVKPTIEIMAALPTVVLGFLAGLWLAPRLEQVFPALLLMVLILPIAVLASGRLWGSLPGSLRRRLPFGMEIVIFMIALTLGIWMCLELSKPFEGLVFGGDFRVWLNTKTGLPYDQRNAVVVGLAMGFAVIPIIFSIAEDAFSNVPRNLISGSLALGASRWQTVTRVVLPTASPGIFSAIMIGFGRVVGETMIVLMATGNTPIMDLNPFNGFRTLSANLAVEIPEAPQGGTLYRTLFLAALLLFAITFVLNTVAEIVRQKLRRRYAQL